MFISGESTDHDSELSNNLLEKTQDNATSCFSGYYNIHDYTKLDFLKLDDKFSVVGKLHSQ